MTFGFQPKDFNFLLSTTKFPTSTFFVYFGVGGKLILQSVCFFNNFAKLSNRVFLPEEIQYRFPGLPFFKIILIPEITSNYSMKLRF